MITTIRLRCVLWLIMWSMFENFPYELEKNTYSAIVGCGTQFINVGQVKLIDTAGEVNYIFIDFLTIIYQLLTWVLKSPSVIVELSVSPSVISVFCFMYFDFLLLGAYTSRIVISSWRTDPFIIMQ